jgi:hypothetical protein
VRTQQNPRDLIRAIHKELKAVEPAMITPEIKVVQQVLYDASYTVDNFEFSVEITLRRRRFARLPARESEPKKRID